MRTIKTWLIVMAAFVAAASSASAQSTTGTISGRVADSQGLALPGVTVTVTSPNLQGTRTVVSSENGDYVVAQLPSGDYTVVFELSGFERVSKTTRVAPTQVVPIDATLGVASVSEVVTVTGQRADVLMQTTQVATNFKQDLIAALPTNRDINATLLNAPAVHPTGPSGAYSIAGAMSYESLFMVNGVNVNENLRGQANDLYVEDAIQETTVATAGISAEYGRFGGGVVNVITKSGGNQFSGSFRDTLNNDNGRALTPFAGDTKTKKMVPTYEYTFGGPVMKDHLWFFTSGRLQNQESTRNLVITRTPYTFNDDVKRYEGKGTFSATSNHSFQGTFNKVLETQNNNTFDQTLSMDERSLEHRQLPQDLFSGSYNGILTPNLFMEARYSQRHFTFEGSGAKSTDLIDGTLLIDRARGNTRYWAATFCGVCDPEKRDNQDLYLKGTYFLSGKGTGTHNVVFGYDYFNDQRFANNHQSGSDYRILGTTSVIRGTDIFPVFINDGSTIIQYNPIVKNTEGTNFRTHSVFANDSWRVGSRLTANVGIRWDKNDGANGAGDTVAKDSAFSPRVGVIWDPAGDQKWSVTGSFAKYVASISNSIADSSSSGGQAATFQYAYRGPSINPDANASNLLAPPAALTALFAWFNANGGTNLPLVGANIPGVATKIPDGLASPNVLEYAGGLNRQFGAKFSARADYVFRDYRDFYSQVTDRTTGKVTNSVGQTFDLTLVENSNAVKRRYQGLTASATWRPMSRVDVGGNYTLSHTYGNFDGENSGSGPVTATVLRYPEYKQESWSFPTGDLAIDQRHRMRAWVVYQLPFLEGLSASILQEAASGVPYGAAGSIDARPFVPDLGYAVPQGAATTTYFFTNRDAYRTEAEYRTDIAANYAYRIKGRTGAQLFGQLQVLNIFDGFQLCGCGASVFANGGNVNAARIDQSILTNSTTASLPRFNPFTTTPVEGVNWQKGPVFGTALNRFAYTTPRTLRLSFGIRF